MIADDEPKFDRRNNIGNFYVYNRNCAIASCYSLSTYIIIISLQIPIANFPNRHVVANKIFLEEIQNGNQMTTFLYLHLIADKIL